MWVISAVQGYIIKREMARLIILVLGWYGEFADPQESEKSKIAGCPYHSVGVGLRLV